MAANIKPKNNQDAFNKVLKAIRKQNYQQSAVGYSCKYRGPNGLRCAAGHLIPNSLYKAEMEGKGLGSCNKVFDPVNEYLKNTSLDLLARLQRAHDNELDKSNPKKAWESKMKEIAQDWNLIYTAPSKEI